MTYDNAEMDIPMGDRIPKEIEDRARELFERRSFAWTGHKWDWAATNDEVRNRFRLQAFIDAAPAAGKVSRFLFDDACAAATLARDSGDGHIGIARAVIEALGLEIEE